MPAPDLSRPRPKPKSSTAKAKKDASGLGRAIINRRAKEQKRIYDEALHNTELPSGLNSVTQENDLDEFLNTAQLAATDFSAERQNIRVLPSTNVIQANPYLLTDQEERELKTRHASNRKRLRVPRRPAWSRDMAKEDLERNEREEFLEWRKGLADMEDRESFLLTPFERNLAVWRQLWRTLERSHLVVQIVDARNPLGFRCEDLETYVKEVGTEGDGDTVPGPGKRRSLLLVNKADLLTPLQRQQWAIYFEQLGIHFAFFSAKVAVELQELEEHATTDTEDSDSDSAGTDSDENGIEDEDVEVSEAGDTDSPPEAGPSSPRLSTSRPEKGHSENEEDVMDGDDASAADHEDDHIHSSKQLFDRTQVLTVEQLEELFLQLSPDLDDFTSEGQPAPKFCVGLVGYPNVGKSSTINALVGQKKVSVSSTPGKTKNFQTIHLSPEIVLCDCPGLVFPQFATTKAGMVCDGVLPIDQMREHTAPVDLVTHRIPKSVLEGIYGLRIPILPISEGGTGIPTAAEFLSVYAVARGFFTSGQGNPDESRASRYILKDYVNAKLLYCHPPPGADADAFNAETRDLIKLALAEKLRQKRAPTQRVGKKASTFLALPDDFSDEDVEVNSHAADGDGTPSVTGTSMATSGRPHQSARASAIERDFFASTNLARAYISGGGPNGTSRSMVAPHQRQLDDTGKRLSSRKMRELESLGAIIPGSTKKHFKANKRAKARSGAGYDQ